LFPSPACGRGWGEGPWFVFLLKCWPPTLNPEEPFKKNKSTVKAQHPTLLLLAGEDGVMGLVSGRFALFCFDLRHLASANDG
jgi:hypothetical protein